VILEMARRKKLLKAVRIGSIHERIEVVCCNIRTCNLGCNSVSITMHQEQVGPVFDDTVPRFIEAGNLQRKDINVQQGIPK
jgi:hypothetical protein